MNMKFLKIAACAAVAVAALSACEEDKHVCALPGFAGFRIEPLVWQPGDSVTITAVQYSLGYLLYKAEYRWSVACTDTTFTKNYEVVYDADKNEVYRGNTYFSSMYLITPQEMAKSCKKSTAKIVSNMLKHIEL